MLQIELPPELLFISWLLTLLRQYLHLQQFLHVPSLLQEFQLLISQPKPIRLLVELNSPLDAGSTYHQHLDQLVVLLETGGD